MIFQIFLFNKKDRLAYGLATGCRAPPCQADDLIPSDKSPHQPVVGQGLCEVSLEGLNLFPGRHLYTPPPAEPGMVLAALAEPGIG